MGTNLDTLSQLVPYVQGGIFAVLLLTASVFDIRKRIIPDRISLAIALTSFLAFEPM